MRFHCTPCCDYKVHFRQSQRVTQHVTTYCCFSLKKHNLTLKKRPLLLDRSELIPCTFPISILVQQDRTWSHYFNISENVSLCFHTNPSPEIRILASIKTRCNPS